MIEDCRSNIETIDGYPASCFTGFQLYSTIRECRLQRSRSGHTTEEPHATGNDSSSQEAQQSAATEPRSESLDSIVHPSSRFQLIQVTEVMTKAQ